MGILEACFGHVKHHFTACDWYVIQTDLVSDKEVSACTHRSARDQIVRNQSMIS